jgi:hypothetical protein
VPPNRDGDKVAHERQLQPPLRHQLITADRSRLDALKEVVDGDVERARDLIQPTGGNPVGALFVPVRLLVGYSDEIREPLLIETQRYLRSSMRAPTCRSKGSTRPRLEPGFALGAVAIVLARRLHRRSDRRGRHMRRRPRDRPHFSRIGRDAIACCDPYFEIAIFVTSATDSRLPWCTSSSVFGGGHGLEPAGRDHRLLAWP